MRSAGLSLVSAAEWTAASATLRACRGSDITPRCSRTRLRCWRTVRAGVAVPFTSSASPSVVRTCSGDRVLNLVVWGKAAEALKALQGQDQPEQVGGRLGQA